MKVTILTAYPNSGEMKRMRDESNGLGIRLNCLNVVSGEDLERQADACGDVVVWRTSGLRKSDDIRCFAGLLKDRRVINLAAMLEPEMRGKCYQQSRVAADFPSLAVIPTFNYEEIEGVTDDIDGGRLKFPLLMKPNIGSEGVGVRLVRDMADLDKLGAGIGRLVVQPYIRNDGDYRIFVMGGSVIYSMKRVAPAGGYVNNVASGGKVRMVGDHDLADRLAEIALKVDDVFGLDYSGVDVIHDLETDDYRFMEINAAPKWARVSESLTGINITRRFLAYCKTFGGG